MKASSIPTEPGVYENVSFETYQAIDAVNVSSLKPWLISPRYARWRENNPPDTDSLKLGRAVHAYLFEHDTFHNRYASLDDTALIEEVLAKRPDLKVVRSSKEYKESFARWEEMNLHKTILKWDEMQKVIASRRAFFDHPESKTVNLDTEKAELTIVWFDRELGVLCKMRLDLFDPRSGRGLDLKSLAKRPTVRVVERQIIDYGYHMQHAFYLRGIRAMDLHQAPTLRFVFLQLGDEFDVTWADPTEDMLTQGWLDVVRAFDAMVRAKKTGQYPGVHPDPVQVSLPAWAFDADNIIDDGTEVIDAE